MRYFCGQSIIYALLVFGICSFSSGNAQQCEWFPGGDASFYRYLESRLTGYRMGPISRDPVNGESFSFEIYVNDSGYADSSKIGPCFNAELSNNMRYILATLPRLNQGVHHGCPPGSRRVYSVMVKQTVYGIEVDPAPFYPQAAGASQKFKWGIALIAAISLCLLIFR
jgi:hypothetical protein